MSSYLLSVYNPAGSHEREFGPYPNAADMEAAFARTAEFNEFLQNSGTLVFAAGLSAPTLGVTVAPDGALIDGPAFHAESYLGGFWIIRAADFDVATRIAAQAAVACGGKVEVRQMESPED
ncbi:YCII-related domain protein [Corynebacterium occultum]|uniref:YCII-related domain protein n=1 Tax=Corynebacterium occultum TaxID=2675219 RepID=A0A6B8VSN8_9CORY|nr:YciI family protein [Corynebacterium occultum]QGU06079.1 YCII-related domain protein [Corynebacterium occultum]